MRPIRHIRPMQPAGSSRLADPARWYSSARGIGLISLIGLICFFGGAKKAEASSLLHAQPNSLGLVGLWRMDEGAGTLSYDFSGGNNHGTLTNGPTWATGKFGGGISFDGSDDYIDVGNILNMGTSNWTVSLWFKGTTSSTGGAIRGIIGKSLLDVQSGRYSLLFENGNLEGMFDRGAGGVTVTTSETPYIDGNWHLVTLVFNRTGNMTLYVDGVSKNSSDISAGSATNMTNTDKFFIGAYQDITGVAPSSGKYFTGSIDDVRVYNRALSATEVATLYNSTGGAKLGKQPAALDSGLVGYWRFDEGSGTTTGDRSSNANTGTLTNGPTWTTGKYGSALLLDGTNDQVDIPHNSALNAYPLTVAAWFKTTNGSSGAGIVNKYVSSSGNGWQLYMVDGNLCAWYFGSGGSLYTGTCTLSTGGFNNGIWHQAVFLVDSTGGTMYVDGIKRGSTLAWSGTPSATTTTTQLTIGKYDSYFPGTIDDVRIYNRALTVDEILQLYQGGGAKISTSSVGAAGSGNLVGWWTFDGKYLSTTTATDSSGQGNNGTLTNGPVPALGKVGQALNFDGSNDYVGIADAAALRMTTILALSAWIKPTASNDGNFHFIFGKASYSDSSDTNSSYKLYLKNDGTIGLYSSASGTFVVSGASVLSTNTWYQVAAVADGVNAKIYINGVQDGTASFSSSFAKGTNADDVQIGTNVSGSNQSFAGSIDDVRIYNKALSAAEVLQLYNMGK